MVLKPEICLKQHFCVLQVPHVYSCPQDMQRRNASEHVYRLFEEPPRTHVAVIKYSLGSLCFCHLSESDFLYGPLLRRSKCANFVRIQCKTFCHKYLCTKKFILFNGLKMIENSHFSHSKIWLQVKQKLRG